MHFFIASLALLLASSISNAQTIPDKNFTKENSAVFLANGFVNFSAISNEQKKDFEQRDWPVLGNDSQIFLKAGMLSNSVKYGVIAKAELNVGSDGRRENPNLDQIFIFSEGDIGRAEFGNIQAVNQKIKTGPASFARGAGGINGKYLEGLNLPSSSSFILLAQSPIGHGGYAANSSSYSQKNNFRALKDGSFDGVEDATKLSYYTPRIEGLQAGVSYTPNAENRGLTTKKYYHNSVVTIRDVLSFGVNYSDYFDNLGVEISATSESGRVRKNPQIQKNLFAYDVAATLSYFGFSVGSSYGSWKDSLSKKNENSPKANYYTLGLAYSFGPISVSVTNLKSRFQKNAYEATALGLDYKLTKDFMPYLEITKFAFKPSMSQISDIKSNRGYVFLTGILFVF